MKKYLLLFTFTLFLSSSLFAATNSSKGYVEGNIGMSSGESTTHDHMDQGFMEEMNGLQNNSTVEKDPTLTPHKMVNGLLNFNTEAGFYLTDFLSFGLSIGYNSLELKQLRNYVKKDPHTQKTSAYHKYANTSSGFTIADIIKIRTLINVAYHYNVEDRLNLFISPALGFDRNFIEYNAKDSADALDEVYHGFNLAAQLSVGGMYYISDDLYLKGTISYDYSSPIFDGKTTNQLASYNGKPHTWAQFDVGFGTRF